MVPAPYSAMTVVPCANAIGFANVVDVTTPSASAPVIFNRFMVNPPDDEDRKRPARALALTGGSWTVSADRRGLERRIVERAGVHDLGRDRRGHGASDLRQDQNRQRADTGRAGRETR